MADEKTPKANKETTEAPAKSAPKSYVVAFSGISVKGESEPRKKGEIVTADELADPDFQLKIGAIVEQGQIVEGQPAPEKPPEEKK